METKDGYHVEVNEDALMDKLIERLETHRVIAKLIEGGTLFHESEPPTPFRMYNELQGWVEDLLAIKPNDRSATDRYHAMAVSKAQDLLAFYSYYCVEKKGLDQ